MEIKTCPNCHASYDGNFCPACGQRFIPSPFTFRVISSFALDLVDFNRGFFNTLFHLLVKPGELIHGYLNGKTRPFNNPVRFSFTLITLMAILALVRSDTEELKVLYIMPGLMVLAILTALFNYIAFSNQRTLAEHTIIATYFAAGLFIVLTFIMFLFLAAESWAMAPYSDAWSASVSISASFIFLFWFNLAVFPGRKLAIVVKTLLYIAFLVVVLLLTVWLVKMLWV